MTALPEAALLACAVLAAAPALAQNDGPQCMTRKAWLEQKGDVNGGRNIIELMGNTTSVIVIIDKSDQTWTIGEFDLTTGQVCHRARGVGAYSIIRTQSL